MRDWTKQKRNWHDRIARNVSFNDFKPFTIDEAKKWTRFDDIQKEDGTNYEKEFQEALDDLVKEGILAKMKSGKYKGKFDDNYDG